MKKIKIYFLLLLAAVFPASAVNIIVGDESTLDWGIDPENWDWDPKSGIECTIPSPKWRDSGGGPMFDEYQICFYDDGNYFYFLKIVGMPSEGILYDDPWNRGPSWVPARGNYTIIAGDLLLDFCSDGYDCSIPVFTRKDTEHAWGSFDDNDESEMGNIYCSADHDLEFYSPSNNEYVGHVRISLGKGNESNKVGNADISYFVQSDIPQYMLDKIFVQGKRYPYGNWMVPIPYNQRHSITQQQMIDNFDIYAVEIKVNKQMLTSLYPGCMIMKIKETMSCGNDILAGEYEYQQGFPGEASIPEFDILKIIVLVLLIPFVLVVIKYKRGSLLKNHKHLRKIFEMFGKR